MATGTIKFWKAEKGYGFIENDDGGPNIFVHESQLLLGVAPDHGVAVSFEIVKCTKGIQARNVSRLIIGEVDENNWTEHIGAPPMKD